MGARRIPGPERARPSPPVIQPTAVYTRRELPAVLRVGLPTVDELIQGGRLQYVAAGKGYVFLGQWLIDWLQSAKTRGTTAGEGPH